ncbi:MAG: BMP family ABC transporter substrate-binding protein [Deltaproteobacteria bacterium]|nr:MAG: BMP family ABC transporter substrate-binding protein [Deltaproteobacteria bacterium]
MAGFRDERRRRAAVVAALVAVNAALLAAGAGRGGGDRTAARVRVGLVFDVGGLGDRSFNDAAYRGLVRAARELGVHVQTIEPGDGSDRESALRQFASQGYDLVIGVGFIFTDDIRRLAGEFPAVRFACVDYAIAPGDPPPPPNLLALRFREHEGAFVVGAIAGLETRTRVVGFVGGMNIPLIRKFEAGYTAGVRHVCPDCRVLSAYAGTDPKAFADPVKGRELADAQYQRGADIVFHASGKTGAGVFQAARERGRFAIGVDSDQFHEAPCCVLTSMVKKVDVAVYRAVDDVVRGRFRGGVRELGLGDDGVGFVYDDNNRDRISPATIERVRQIEADIRAGRLEVPHR